MNITATISALFVVGCTTIYTDPSRALDPPADGRPPADAGADSAVDSGSNQVTHGEKTVFVSSVAYAGEELGGLAGADANCAKLASAAGLAGEYKAWLSTLAATAAGRLSQSTDAYLLVGGTVVAANWDALTGGVLMHAINVNETGGGPPTVASCMDRAGVVDVWTDTLINGSADPENFSCDSWTFQDMGLNTNGLVGDAQATDFNWTDTECANDCATLAALYCLEQ